MAVNAIPAIKIEELNARCITLCVHGISSERPLRAWPNRSAEA